MPSPLRGLERPHFCESKNSPLDNCSFEQLSRLDERDEIALRQSQYR
jgi:hypothetical protein